MGVGDGRGRGGGDGRGRWRLSRGARISRGTRTRVRGAKGLGQDAGNVCAEAVVNIGNNGGDGRRAGLSRFSAALDAE